MATTQAPTQNVQALESALYMRTFSPRLQELVGYGVYSGLIGHIDKKSPMQLLNNDGTHSMVWDAV